MTSITHIFPTQDRVRNQGIGKYRGDPLPRLLAQIIDRAGEPVSVERAASRPWASALFQGRRHVILLRFDGPDAALRRTRFVTGLEEAEWTLTGHFVADIVADDDDPPGTPGNILALSALTIEDW